MKALTIVSSVVFLHVLAFVVLVNGCTPRALRGQYDSAPANGAPTVGQSQEADNSAPGVGQTVTEEVPAEPLPPTPPEAVEEKPEPKAASEGAIYVVKQNDSLWLIAKKHKTTVNAICEANGIKKNAVLRVGMKLKVPAGQATESAKPANAENASGTTYTVKKGDALSLIARRHGVTVKALKQANNLTSDNIRIGQKLVIPGKAAPAKQEAAPAPAPAPVAPKTEEQPAVSAEPEVAATEEAEEPELGISAEPIE